MTMIKNDYKTITFKGYIAVHGILWNIKKKTWHNASKDWMFAGILLLIYGISLFSIPILILLFEEFDGFALVQVSAFFLLALMMLLISKSKLHKAIQDKDRIHKLFKLSEKIHPSSERGLVEFNLIIEDMLNKNNLEFENIPAESDLTNNRIIETYKLLNHDIEIRIRASAEVHPSRNSAHEVPVHLHCFIDLAFDKQVEHVYHLWVIRSLRYVVRSRTCPLLSIFPDRDRPVHLYGIVYQDSVSDKAESLIHEADRSTST